MDGPSATRPVLNSRYRKTSPTTEPSETAHAMHGLWLSQETISETRAHASTCSLSYSKLSSSFSLYVAGFVSQYRVTDEIHSGPHDPGDPITRGSAGDLFSRECGKISFGSRRALKEDMCRKMR